MRAPHARRTSRADGTGGFPMDEFGAAADLCKQRGMDEAARLLRAMAENPGVKVDDVIMSIKVKTVIANSPGLAGIMQAIHDHGTPIGELRQLMKSHESTWGSLRDEANPIIQNPLVTHPDLRGSVLRFEDPFGSAIDPQDWEANPDVPGTESGTESPGKPS
jgi:hypothetical protein